MSFSANHCKNSCCSTVHEGDEKKYRAQQQHTAGKLKRFAVNHNKLCSTGANSCTLTALDSNLRSMSTLLPKRNISDIKNTTEKKNSARRGTITDG